jgi:hypothetical protein
VIVHVVCCKFRDEGDIGRVAELLEALPPKVPVIRRLEVGRDVVRSPRSYDLALTVEVDSLDDLDAYRQHPDHVVVGSLIAELTTGVTVVDYER